MKKENSTWKQELLAHMVESPFLGLHICENNICISQLV